jgi:hypothetical protein
LYLLVQTLVVVGLFLAIAGFFSQWDGQMVGVLQPAGTNPSVYEVLISEGAETRIQKMPAVVMDGLGLPVLPLGILPEVLPDTAPATRKSRFTFHYLVQRPEPEGTVGVWVHYPTTTSQAVALAVVLWLIALGLRNMAFAGSPFWIERSDSFLPKGLTQAGTVAQTTERGRKTVPPARKQRGPRRR